MWDPIEFGYFFSTVAGTSITGAGLLLVAASMLPGARRAKWLRHEEQYKRDLRVKTKMIRYTGQLLDAEYIKAGNVKHIKELEKEQLDELKTKKRALYSQIKSMTERMSERRKKEFEKSLWISAHHQYVLIDFVLYVFATLFATIALANLDILSDYILGLTLVFFVAGIVLSTIIGLKILLEILKEPTMIEPKQGAHAEENMERVLSSGG